MESSLICFLSVYFNMFNPLMFEDILSRLQNTEMSPEDVAATLEENRKSCVGKLIADIEFSIQFDAAYAEP